MQNFYRPFYFKHPLLKQWFLKTSLYCNISNRKHPEALTLPEQKYRLLTGGGAMYKGEKVNSITHLIGSLLSVVCLVLLLLKATRQGDPWKIVSFSIYGATLVLLFSFSTLYHSLKGRGKKFFQKLDHFSIFLLIAGTYTPFTLVTLRGAWGWSLFGVIWGLAAVGIALELCPRKGARILPVVLHLVMGWLIIIAMPQLAKALPAQGIFWLTAGGLFYTIGVIFYAMDKRFQHAHGIWHLFVLAGSLSHYGVILFYVD